MTFETLSGVRKVSVIVRSWAAQVLDDVVAELLPDEADAADEAQHERRQREQREEARLGGETGDPVAQADPGRATR